MPDNIEEGKKAAGYAAVDDNVKDGLKIGIGSGSTIIYSVERISSKFNTGDLKHIMCVPTSFQARQSLLLNGLPIGDLSQYPKLDIAIDGADEVDADLVLIKGGGGCLTQEKIVASCAKELYIVCDYRKDVKVLGTTYTKGIPIEVVPMAYIPVKQKIVEQFGGTCELRLAHMKAGPIITDNGNFILDWEFDKVHDWKEVNIGLQCIPGILDTGLFVSMTTKAYFGQADGSVVSRP